MLTPAEDFSTEIRKQSSIQVVVVTCQQGTHGGVIQQIQGSGSGLTSVTVAPGSTGGTETVTLALPRSTVPISLDRIFGSERIVRDVTDISVAARQHLRAILNIAHAETVFLCEMVRQLVEQIPHVRGRVEQAEEGRVQVSLTAPLHITERMEAFLRGTPDMVVSTRSNPVFEDALTSERLLDSQAGAANLDRPELSPGVDRQVLCLEGWREGDALLAVLERLQYAGCSIESIAHHAHPGDPRQVRTTIVLNDGRNIDPARLCVPNSVRSVNRVPTEEAFLFEQGILVSDEITERRFRSDWGIRLAFRGRRWPTHSVVGGTFTDLAQAAEARCAIAGVGVPVSNAAMVQSKAAPLPLECAQRVEQFKRDFGQIAYVVYQRLMRQSLTDLLAQSTEQSSA